jgi:hypothetical protein
MADNIPTPPGGATPPKPAEASKVQPKKETVRINLPPKPTSAPTIKLPTLAPGAPAPQTSAAAPVAIAVAAAPAAPAPAKAPAPAATAGPATPARVSATATAAKPAAAPAPRPVAAAVVTGLTGLDKGLAIAAAVVSLAALGCVLYLAYFLKDNPPS